MRFIHTSDWQFGRVFRQVDDGTMAVLWAERLDAIGRIGKLAREQRAPLELVAGDVYDGDKPGDRTLEQPIERMRGFPDVRWHLLPGNHDSHQPNGLWDRRRKKGLPDNVLLQLESGPKEIVGEIGAGIPQRAASAGTAAAAPWRIHPRRVCLIPSTLSRLAAAERSAEKPASSRPPAANGARGAIRRARPRGRGPACAGGG